MNGGFNDMQADDIAGQLYNCQGERDYFREDRLRIAAERDRLRADLAEAVRLLKHASILTHIYVKYRCEDCERVDAFLAEHEDVS